MKITFTICSNNYLAQAKALGDSIKLYNPSYNFFIGLTDKLSDEIDYDNKIGYEIITSDIIGIPEHDTLWKRFSIIEFNTNVKPFYFQYFIKRFKKIDFLIYLDPDIVVYNSLNLLEMEFGETGEVLLTPHVLTPIEIDDKTPGENVFLNYGIYNLGFIGFKNPVSNNKLLIWWQERTYNLGFIETSKGLFVDQLWINLAPVFFDNVSISKNPGLNMAPWNLHERHISERNDILYVNEIHPLTFYHFSGFNYNNPDVISKKYSRYNFITNPDLKNIYLSYCNTLLINGIIDYEKRKCHYMTLREEHLKNELKKKMHSSFSTFLKYKIRSILPLKYFYAINSKRK